MPAFFIASSDIHGADVTITGSLCHHLGASLRVKPGERLRLTDEQRRRYHVTVIAVAQERLSARIVDQLDGPAESGPAVLLAQALLKGDHMDWVVQKASELGVRTIVPIIAQHGVVRPQAGRIAAQVSRWQRIATEAAQQSEQWEVPHIMNPIDSRQFFAQSAAACCLILAERREAAGLSTVPLPFLVSESVTLTVGPEGGWGKEELDMALAQGSRAVTLGSHILRADTAAVTALGILQSRLGRLG